MPFWASACGLSGQGCPRAVVPSLGSEGTGILLRPVVAPAIFVGVAVGLGLAPSAVLAGRLAVVVPAASNGYVLACKPGGDAALYAAILSCQTLLSVALIPVLAIAEGALV